MRDVRVSEDVRYGRLNPKLMRSNSYGGTVWEAVPPGVLFIYPEPHQSRPWWGRRRAASLWLFLLLQISPYSERVGGLAARWPSRRIDDAH